MSEPRIHIALGDIEQKVIETMQYGEEIERLLTENAELRRQLAEARAALVQCSPWVGGNWLENMPGPQMRCAVCGRVNTWPVKLHESDCAWAIFQKGGEK